MAAVKEHIQAGDVFQLVLSQRFRRRTFADPFEIYRCGPAAARQALHIYDADRTPRHASDCGAWQWASSDAA